MPRIAPTGRLKIGHVLGAAAFVALPLEVFSWPSVTPVMVAAALAALLAGGWRGSLLPRPLAALLALLLVYGSASALWSLEPSGVLELSARLLGTFAAGLVLVAAARGLSPAERRFCGTALVLGDLLGLALLQLMLLTQASLLDYLRNLAALAPLIGHQRPFYFPVGFDPAMTLAALLAWPVMAVLRRRYGSWAAAGAAAVTFAVLLQGESMTSKVAFAAGLAVLFAARLAPKAVAAALAALLVFWLAAAPLLLRPEVLAWLPHTLPVKDAKQRSLEHRLEIWNFVGARIDERPLLGWGFDSSRWMPGGHEILANHGELLPLHPHDAALQLRLDLGLPGVALGIAFVLVLFRGLRSFAGGATEAALTLALITVASIYAALSYNLWHVWWLTMLWLAGAFVVAAAADRGRSGSGGASS